MNGIEMQPSALNGETIQAVAWALVHFLWQGALVGLLAAALLRTLRGAKATTRYGVAVALFALLALLPVGTALRRSGMSALSASPTANNATAGVAQAAPLRTLEASEKGAEPSAIERTARLLAPALPGIFAAWLLGVFALGASHLGGWWRLRRLVRQAAPLGDALQVRALRLARSLGIGHTVRLLESAAVPVPAVIGWLRPAVLVPASSMAGLTPWQLDAILAHELAHVRRHDYLVNLLQAAVETLLFYHPAVWWLSNEIRRERENCCDDLAVELCGDRLGYARALADLEGLRSVPSRLALAADGGSLLQRVRRLTGVPAGPASRPRRSWLVGMLALALVPAFLALRWGPAEAAPGRPADHGKIAQTDRPVGRLATVEPALGGADSKVDPAREAGPRQGAKKRAVRQVAAKGKSALREMESQRAVANALSGTGTARAKWGAISKGSSVLLPRPWKEESEAASRFPWLLPNDPTRLLVLEASPDYLGAIAGKGGPGC